MRVYLGADHAGYELKVHLVSHLSKQGYDVVDLGAHSFDPDDDYPAFSIHTGLKVVGDAGSLGVVIGGSGNGEQMAANKVPGVRAALAWNEEIARLAREHNDANVLGVGARQHTLGEATNIIETFLATPFSRADRHQRRIGQITGYELTHEPPDLPG